MEGKKMENFDDYQNCGAEEDVACKMDDNKSDQFSTKKEDVTFERLLLELLKDDENKCEGDGVVALINDVNSSSLFDHSIVGASETYDNNSYQYHSKKTDVRADNLCPESKKDENHGDEDGVETLFDKKNSCSPLDSSIVDARKTDENGSDQFHTKKADVRAHNSWPELKRTTETRRIKNPRQSCQS